MEARNSSMMDMMRLKALRETRLQMRAERAHLEAVAKAAREAEKKAEAQAARERELADLAAARAELEQARAERCSRTTVERLCDLRGELRAFDAERELQRREAEHRLAKIERRLARPDRSGLWAFGAAAVVSLSLVSLIGSTGSATAVAALPSDVVGTAPLPESLAQDEPMGQELLAEQSVAVDDTVTELPGELDATAVPVPEPEIAPQPAPTQPRPAATRPARAKTPAARTVKARTRTPASTVDEASMLDGLDDCGNDPICGL